MSLRTAGNQYFQTPPTPLLDGASTASLSIWVRVNPGSIISDPTGTKLFGDAAGKLSVGLSAIGDLRVGWSSNDGSANGGSKYSQPLIPGTSYHVAVTWQDGAQHYYVNGLLVGSDKQKGTLGLVGKHQPQSFQLGTTAAGADVTLDEPTLWVGYALTAADVVGLRDRVVHPEGIAPGSIALQWTLAGPDGAAARRGDAGLADASASGLNLSAAVGTPTYQGGVLTFAMADGGCSATVAPSGEGILFTFRDEATNPVAVRSLESPNEVQSILLSSKPAGGSLTLNFGGKATGPIAVAVNPPPSYFQWNATVDAPGDYDLSVSLFTNVYFVKVAIYSVFDGDTLLGTAVLSHFDGRDNPPGFTDGTLTRGGSEVGWAPLGRFTLSGKVLKVRVSADLPADPAAGTGVWADGLRVASADGKAVQRISNASPPAQYADVLSNSWHSYTSNSQLAGPTNGLQGNAVTAGPYYSLDPAAVRSALEALPNVGAGNVLVTGIASAFSPMRIEFAGALGLASQPLIAASDPAAAVARQVAGGGWPQVRVNGGAPIPLSHPFYGPGVLPCVMFPLLQSRPVVEYLDMGTYTTGLGGPWAGPVPSALSGGARFYNPDDHGSPSATWSFQGLPAGSYRASVTWPPAARYAADAGYTVTDSTGAVLGTFRVDQTIAPAGAADRGVPWQVLGTFTLSRVADYITINAVPGKTGLTVADSAKLERLSPDASTRIKAGDVVTYSAGPGWAATASGMAPAASSKPVANAAGGTISPAFADQPKTMGVGWNMSDIRGDSGLLAYANLARYIQQIEGLAHDEDRYPTRMVAGGEPTRYSRLYVTNPTNTIQSDGGGWPNMRAGRYTVLWKGKDASPPSDLSFEDSGAVEVPELAIFPAPFGQDNRRVFDIPPSGPYAATIQGRLHSSSQDPDGTYKVNITDLRIYPPEVDPVNPPKFLPSFLDKLRGASYVRFLNPLQGINGNATTFADFNPPQTLLPRFGAARGLYAKVLEIRGRSTDAWFNLADGPVYQVTTDGPHGLGEATYIVLNGDSGPARYSNGTSANISGAGGQYYFGHAHVVSPTVFLYQLGPTNSDGSPVAMTNVLTPANCSVGGLAGNCMPIDDMIDMCNAVNADLYLNICFTANDDACSRIGDLCARRLNPGLKVLWEASNEVWNSGQTPYFWSRKAGYGNGYDPGSTWLVPYQCEQSRHQWNLAGAAMAALGRGGDLVRVLGANHFDPGGTTNGLAEYTATHSIAFDALAVAPYIDNKPTSGGVPDNDPTLDLYTPDQMLDVFEIHYNYTGHERLVPAHRAYLDARGHAGVKIVGYEGGPEDMLFGRGITGSGLPARVGSRSHAVHRHPRFFHLLLRILQVYQDSGMDRFQFFCIDGEDGGPFGSFPMWTAYNGTYQAKGTGDPVLDAANIATPDRMDLVKCQVGGAFSKWASLAGAVPPKPPAPGRPIPGRNGQVTTHGLPRGASRPTR